MTPRDLPRLAMTAGAAGFASRSGAVDVLLDTCASVAAGKMVFPFIDVRELQADPIQSLSRKERAMLEALSKGMTNRELSAELGISTNTVKFHPLEPLRQAVGPQSGAGHRVLLLPRGCLGRVGNEVSIAYNGTQYNFLTDRDFLQLSGRHLEQPSTRRGQT